MESLANEPSESNNAAEIKPADCDVRTSEETLVFEELPLKTSKHMPVFEESPFINNSDQEPTLKSQVKTVRIKLPPTCLHTSQEVQESIVGTGKADHESLHNESDIGDIDQDIDDALDEGYMGMECTLERGFSLNESSIARDLRMERYREVAVEYKKISDISRYRQALKHLIPVRKPPKEKNEMPIDKTGLYSFISYSWITSLMWKAYKTGLKEDDVPICSKYDMCGYNTDRLEELWNEEIKNMGKEDASFHRVVLRFIKTRLIIGIIIFMITLGLGFIGPTIFMRYLITWLSSDEPFTTGLIWTFGLVLSEFVRILMFGLVWSINYRTGIRLRSACLGLIFKKLMRMSTLGNKSIGEVINLFANDAQRIYDYVVLGPLIVGGPFVAVGGVIYILWLLGPWALFGMLTFLLFYPFQYGISRLTSYLRRQTVAITDERVCKMNELLSCVKLIKMYAWEKSFSSSIAEIRSRERKLLEKSAYVQSISLAMAPTVPVLAAIVTFLAHIGAGYNLTAAQAMSYMGLVSHLRFAMDCTSYCSIAIREGQISLKRAKSILLMEEISPYIGKPKWKSTIISMEGATLAWDAVSFQQRKKNKKKSKKEDSSPAHKLLPNAVVQGQTDVLFGIDLKVKKGELLGICGGVGAGKSSLVSALLGHMRLQSGTVSVQGSVAYVGQQPWILNASFRDNILLDESFDAKRYYRAIHACNLSQDIGVLPAGDFTEIGERGINLSGGQKQRLSLARALYANKDLYLLDDPLSAVDSHVGCHIFQWLIKGALKDKTTVFITHQLQYLPQCDRVLYLKEGQIAELGTHMELVKKTEEYASLYRNHMESMAEEDKKRERESESPIKTRQDSIRSNDSLQNGIRSTTPEKSTEKEDKKDQSKVPVQLIADEKMEKGDIPLSIYHIYLKAAGGYIISTLVILTFVLNVGSTAFSSWWLSLWLSDGSGNTTITIGNETYISENIADNPRQNFYQTVYACLIFAILGTSLVRGYTFMKTTLRASSQMHDQVFVKVLRSPMSLFDTTPVGRIINLFSRDMDEIDVRLPMTLETFIQNIWLIMSSLLFVCMIFPHFLPILVVLAIIFLFIRNIFRIGIRDFKRMENVSRSPVYSHISATVNGLATINAYGKQEMFTKKFMVLFDENSCVFFLFNCAMRWLAIRLDILALLVTACTAFLSLLLRGYVDAAFAGLALAYAAQLSGIFQFTVRLSTETEARFTSVQRIINYAKGLVSEAPPIQESKHPDADWPKYGRISFRKVQMKYRPDTPIVLKEVTFEIDSMENIGVVGRTGSGKSSLGIALFRLVELSGGSIRIDGANISTLSLEDLRSRLSIIPQDPVLFIGTVRYNLDPFDHHSDETIWSALEQSHMKERISNLDLKLNAHVIENGENFSVGERQLLCMARALLRNSKILFLDEATAAIDTETDMKIQKTLKEAFKSCTMITVAHRLNTVMSCSRVLVMDDGEVAEFDTPKVLLSNPSSLFFKMVAAADSIWDKE